MKTTILFLLTILLFALTDKGENSDNEIYDLVTRHFSDSLTNRPLIVDSTTFFFKYNKSGIGTRDKDFYTYFKTPMDGFNFCVDFFNENKTITAIKNLYTDTAKFTLLTTTKLNSIFSTKDRGINWENFYKQYPHAPGYNLISKIKYNSTNDLALVYIENYCGRLCGSGYLILLQRQKDNWKVVNTDLMWVS